MCYPWIHVPMYLSICMYYVCVYLGFSSFFVLELLGFKDGVLTVSRIWVVSVHTHIYIYFFYHFCICTYTHISKATWIQLEDTSCPRLGSQRLHVRRPAAAQIQGLGSCVLAGPGYFGVSKKIKARLGVLVRSSMVYWALE